MRDQHFKRADASSYDDRTDAFDHYTQRFTAPLARRLVDFAELAGSERILDVGTGTGIVAFEAGRRLGPSGRVVGIDLSDGMLASARAQAESRGVGPTIEFRKADAEGLDFAPGSFDAVLSLFTLMHLPNPERAMREMHRVLRPGGRLVVAYGSGPPLASLSGLRRKLRHARDIVASRRGRCLIAPDFLHSLMEAHGLRADTVEETEIARTPPTRRAQRLLDMVRSAGFSSVTLSWVGERAVLGTPAEFWELQEVYSSRARKRLASAPPERVAALREDFLARAARVQERGGELVYPVGMRVIMARR